MKPATFREYSLVEAESELVGACIDHESALRVALSMLAVDDFRSENAHELRRVFYVLAGWLSKGLWDTATNRERLALYFDDFYIEGLWCGLGMFPEYVTALATAIRESNALLDNAIAAAKEWQENNTLSVYRPPTSPPLVVKEPPYKRFQKITRGGVL